MAVTLQESFDSRRNSIGFLRWFLAFVVIFSHAGPLAGFYDSHSLGSQFSTEQSFGGVAVAGFFCLSGFLITRSRMGRSTIFRFFWRRVLRIFPAFWTALLLVVLVLAPIAWWHSRGTVRGYVSAPTDSPLMYFANNMWLKMNQLNIAGMGSDTPLGACCTLDWNGSAWTLFYEFKGYVLVGVLGLFGVLGHRMVATALFVGLLIMNTLLFLGVAGNFAAVDPLMSDLYSIMLLTPFMFGVMLALWAHKIPIDDRLALAGGLIAIFTYFFASGWNVYGQFGFLYLVIWAAVRLPLTRWEKYGDFSYGIYIYAWPIMQFAAFFGVQRLGWVGYHVVIAVLCHLAAYVSWHCIEKPALSLKNWTPGWLAALMRRGRPLNDRIKKVIVNPRFSTTHYANRVRDDEAALAAERRDDHLVTEMPEERSGTTEERSGMLQERPGAPAPREPGQPDGHGSRMAAPLGAEERDRAGLSGGR